jgi:hypothetical protein
MPLEGLQLHAESSESVTLAVISLARTNRVREECETMQAQVTNKRSHLGKVPGQLLGRVRERVPLLDQLGLHANRHKEMKRFRERQALASRWAARCELSRCH